MVRRGSAIGVLASLAATGMAACGLDAMGRADSQGPSDASAGLADVRVAPVDAGVADASDGSVQPGPTYRITAPDGGTYTVFGPDAATPCSMGGSDPASFVLHNDAAAAVRLDWVNYACDEQPYGTLAPGGERTQGTYVTHRWRVRDAQDGGMLVDFRLDSPGTYAVTVY